MKTAIITGATGLTGKELVKLLVKDKTYHKITLLVRKKIDISIPSVDQVIFDFDKLVPEDKLKADEMYCCIGTTIKKAGSKVNFIKVDLDYVVNTAQIAYNNGVKKFAVVSAMGANKKSLFFYNRVKGEMEEKVKKIGFEACAILRPSLITGKRDEFRLGEWLAKIIMLMFSFFIPVKYKAVNAEKIAMVMISALNEKKGNVVFNSDFIYKTKLPTA